MSSTDCKVKMQDGRAFTDYRPAWIINQQSAMGVDQYRNYLTHQAVPIMQMNNLKEIERNGCTMCVFQPNNSNKHIQNL